MMLSSAQFLFRAPRTGDPPTTAVVLEVIGLLQPAPSSGRRWPAGRQLIALGWAQDHVFAALGLLVDVLRPAALEAMRVQHVDGLNGSLECFDPRGELDCMLGVLVTGTNARGPERLDVALSRPAGEIFAATLINLLGFERLEMPGANDIHLFRSRKNAGPGSN